MRIIYVRHGEKAEELNTPDPRLTPLGEEMARSAGAWLRERGYAPSVVVHTPFVRTRQTAAAIVGQLTPAPHVVETDHGWNNVTGLNNFAAQFGDGALLAGHHHSQNALAKLPGATPVPRNHRAAVFVVERGTDGWRCVDQWLGMLKSSATP